MNKPVDAVSILPIDALVPHPKNPRLSIRRDVVDSIKANLEADRGFSSRHALTVRPCGDSYQIISGHHRRIAAAEAGLTEVPCWIADLDDDAAYMALITDNSQGELSPLEVGMHALECVGKGSPGRGKKGGLSEYARKIGKHKDTIAGLVSAAAVYSKLSDQSDDLLSRSAHLSEIHSAPSELWPLLVEHMLRKGWTVEETKRIVATVKQFSVPADDWCARFFPLVDVVERYVDTLEFSPDTVARLIKECEWIRALVADRPNRKEYLDEFDQWMAENKGGDAWDARKLIGYGRALEARLEEEAATTLSCYTLGDWRDSIGEIKDGRIALLFTDPPYGMGYQSDYRLDRTKPRKHDRIEGDESLDSIAKCVESFLPKLAEDAHVLMFCHWRNEPEVRELLEVSGLLIRGSLIWVKNNTGMGDPSTTFAPKHERIIHAVKGSPKIYSRLPDVLECDRVPTDRHPTEKPTELLQRLIEATTVEGELVVDPFAGVASTLVAAIACKRECLGFEINKEYHSAGTLRL